MELRIAEIMRILPHRYPFSLVDRVVEVDLDKRIVALKNVSINEPFFTGHFPSTPVMPGVLTIESMAQAGAILGLLEKNADLSEDARLFHGNRRSEIPPAYRARRSDAHCGGGPAPQSDRLENERPGLCRFGACGRSHSTFVDRSAAVIHPTAIVSPEKLKSATM